MNSLKVGLFFDAWEGCGLGLFSRCLALAHAWKQTYPNASFRFCPLVPAAERAMPIQALGTSLDVASPSSTLDESALAPFDLVLVDSYQPCVQTLDWWKPGTGKKIILLCDSPWEGLTKGVSVDAILDATFALPPCAGLHSGTEAVFLNPDLFSVEKPQNRDLPFCFALGNSSQMASVLATLEHFFFGSSPNYAYSKRAPQFRSVELQYVGKENRSQIWPVAQVLARAKTLVVGAGQTLWEAALLREEFWVVSLQARQAAVLQRLTERGILITRERQFISKGGVALFVEIPAATREMLGDQKARTAALTAELFPPSSQKIAS